MMDIYNKVDETLKLSLEMLSLDKHMVVYVLEYAICQDKRTYNHLITYCCLKIISPIDKKQHKLNLI